MQVYDVTHWPYNLRARTRYAFWIGVLGGPQKGTGPFGIDKNHLFLPRFENSEPSP